MRRTQTVTITSSGRDQGKAFLITEMPASQAERWGLHALLALAKGGLEVPDEVIQSGMAGIATLGISAIAHLNVDDADKLMDEMFACIQRVPDPSKPQIPPRGLVEDDIEEIGTRIQLRVAVLKLHVDFSQVAGLFRQGAAAQKSVA